MNRILASLSVLALAALCLPATLRPVSAQSPAPGPAPSPAPAPLMPGQTKPATNKQATYKGRHPDFRTSDRCVACHNGITTASGAPYSIGVDWSASIMANSPRDPYWQGSIRRETLDHPESSQAIQNECAACHMPLQRLEDRQASRDTQVFANLPIQKFPHGNRAAADGVTCAVCHQIEPTGLGTRATFNGQVNVAPPNPQHTRPEYGPYETDLMHQAIMQSSTGGFVPQAGAQVRDAALCASCHTLYTDALGPGGVKVGTLPEQMPFQEWQHSDFGIPSNARYQTCQQCHMPEVKGPTAITALYGQQRDGARHHTFIGANFLMETVLRDHRDELAVEASPEELTKQVDATRAFLQSQAARVTVSPLTASAGQLDFDVTAVNLGGHKLPTAYPSRRAWLHVTVTDASGRIVFESGHLNPDGSIVGNANDRDPLQFEPHHPVITSPNQVEIYEDILKDNNGRVTTGILAAVTYFKDNRLLPAGFDKASAPADIAVVGEAATDPHFTDRGSRIHYRVPTNSASGPLHVTAELLYQPIGFRWAHNLGAYTASEPQRWVKLYAQHAQTSALVLAHAEGTTH